MSLLCKKPWSVGFLTPVPCGKCIPCRINIRRVWTLRLMLEKFMHDKSCFVTLTYAQEHLPRGGTLVPRHAKQYIDRLRIAYRRLTGRKLRYFYVGEYGGRRFGNSKAKRDINPHYHMALYGIDREHLALIQEKWKFGNVDVDDLNERSAQYIIGYVIEKLAKKKLVPSGFVHEFNRQSTKPGIANGAAAIIAKAIPNGGDIPDQIRLGGRMMPVGRYLKRKIGEIIGIPESAGTAEYAKEMFDMWNSASDSEKEAALTPAALVVHRNRGRVLQTEAKFKIHSRENEL